MSLDQKIKNAIAKKGSQLIKQVETFALAEAQRQTPIDTGALEESIRIEDETDTGFVLRWGNTSTVDYQAYVARGTRYQKANPFDLRTLQAIKNKFKGTTGTALKSASSPITTGAYSKSGFTNTFKVKL